MSNTQLSTKEKQQVCELYKSGKDSVELSKQFNVVSQTIRNILKRNNIDRRKSSSYRRKNINHQAFSEPLNEAKKYWIGFLMADGCVSERSGRNYSVLVSLAKKDSEHVKKFKKFLNSDHTITKSEYENTTIHKLIFTSTQIANDLAKYNIVPNKTDKNVKVKHLQNDRHFWRGMIDGDGSLYNVTTQSPALSFTNQKSLTYQFYSFVKEYLDTNAKPRENRWTYEFTLSNLKALKLAKTLYEDSSVYLDRKFNRFKQLKNHYN